MIRWANSDDIPALRVLMSDAFGDSEAQTAVFFERLFKPETALVYCIGSRIVSALYLLPAIAFAGGEQYSARYIYAAATASDCRGRGYMGRLLDAAAELLAERGCDYLTLYAANDNLVCFYENNGYTSCLGMRTNEYNADDGCVITLSAASADYVYECRRSAVSKRGGVHWSGRLFDYAYQFYIDEGMQWIEFRDGYALVDAERAEVHELCCEEHSDDVLRSICRQFGWSGCRYFDLSDAQPTLGMVRPLHDGLPEMYGVIGLCLQ